MTAFYKNILLACPGNAVTAGPEAIHQLASDLIRLGANAAIVYFPFSKDFKTPELYKKYGVPIVKYRDTEGDLFIFPEIVTTYALKIHYADAGIWWMSVNNYTCVRYGYVWRDKIRYLKNVAKRLRPIGGIKRLAKLKHFAQSYYALDFLKSNGIVGNLLSDPIPVYTSKNYLENLPDKLSEARRANSILYNPRKGKKTIELLIKKFPHWQFIPLIGFNREQLANKFLCSKLYIDFGHHPGKDRLPREAAIHGCCVITSQFGSAENPKDINIPCSYKIDPRSPQFLLHFKDKVDLVFNDFEKCFTEFTEYRQIISLEQIDFDKQIKLNFLAASDHVQDL
jgi:hypothetical protein